jgi:hypothetical protein
MNESFPSAKVINVPASEPLPFSSAFITRRAFAALVLFGLLGCDKGQQKPQKNTPRPEGGDEPVFAVEFSCSPTFL